MSLRIGIDLDGTLADLSSAYHEIEARLFAERTETPEADETAASAAARARIASLRLRPARGGGPAPTKRRAPERVGVGPTRTKQRRRTARNHPY